MASSATRSALRGAPARDAVLDAARRQFLAEGLRRTSVESIAREAGVSRPTIYAHFADKAEIFRTIVTELHDEQFAAMQAAAAAPGTLHERLVAVLSARFTPFVALTSSSPHGAELLDENSRECSDITRASRRRSLRVVEQVLDDAARAGEVDLAAHRLTAAEAASVIYDCARGAKEDATTTPAAYAKRLRRIVGVLIGGLSPA